MCYRSLCYIKKGDRLRNSVDKITPLGGKKEAGAPRPLKVCMKNVKSVQSVIKHGKLLRKLQKGESNGYSVNFKRYSFLPTYLERKETLVEL